LIGLSCSNPKYLKNDFTECLTDCSTDIGTYGDTTTNASSYTCNNCDYVMADCSSCLDSTICN